MAINVEILGKFYDNHSLSLVNRNLALELSKNSNYNLFITPLDTIDPKYNLDKDTIKNLKKLESKDVVPDIQIRHSYPPIWLWPPEKNTKVIYIQPWEYSKFLFEWQYKFETFADHLVVPSQSEAQVVLNGGINPKSISVIPNGYNSEIFNKEPVNIDLEKYGINKNKFNFVYVGNAQWRKGIQILTEAWKKSFKKYDNCSLIIKDNPGVYGSTNLLDELIKLQYKTECANITYIDDDLSDHEMAAIYKNSKAIVHPYRAEGFGMHIQEAVACGCFPIVPDEGPHEEYLPKDIGARIKTVKRAININDPAVFAMKPGDATTLMSTHTFYHEPTVQSLEHILKWLYYTHDKKPMYEKLQNLTLRNTWENVVRQYSFIIDKVHDEHETPKRFRS